MVDASQNQKSRRSSETTVLAAAEKVFVERGYDGARMQEIADVAGINKAMLHYYFRSKERLFAEVFRAILERALPPLVETLGSELPLGLKIRRFIESYLDALDRTPGLPAFILAELNRDPASFDGIIREKAARLVPVLQQQLDEAAAGGKVRPISATDLVSILMSLCVFPYAAKPFLQPLFGLDGKTYRSFLESRKTALTNFAFSALRPD